MLSQVREAKRLGMRDASLKQRQDLSRCCESTDGQMKAWWHRQGIQWETLGLVANLNTVPLNITEFSVKMVSEILKKMLIHFF